MWQQPLVACVLTVLLAGCQPRGDCRGDSPAVAASPHRVTNPVRVSVTMGPRAGVIVPRGATFEIVFRRTDYEHGIFAIIPVRTTDEWPVRFDASITWPNVPNKGEEVNWKGSPPTLSIFARGSASGHAAFISEPREYTVGDAANDRPVDLVILPLME